ncbi:unnamed protein product [Ranitomeya imitator]|uniref:Uncharacterized protein n=1 Tax=Ranitomeya imitator TaxID=111125 RepID=A0ABN9L062_9NEOB|nr:unnamed protein product [Ranitomeya imitator]
MADYALRILKRDPHIIKMITDDDYWLACLLDPSYKGKLQNIMPHENLEQILARRQRNFSVLLERLANNHLPDISCIELASGIKKCQSLKKIDLSGNSLSGYYFAALEKAMSSPDCKIEELRLLGFDLSAISCNQLASVIKNTQSLKILDLSYNHLVGSHFNVLMEALSSPECRIQELQ